MPEIDNQSLLALWLEQALSAEQQVIFEQRCIQDAHFAQQVATANQMALHAEQFAAQPPPNWDIESTWSGEQKQAWWAWAGLPALSFATSLLAIVMVLSGVQVRLTQGSMTIALGQQANQADVQALVDQHIARLQQNQQSVMSQFASALQQQQVDAGTRLTDYLLSASRQERREDFAELIRFINQQRNDDQQFYARQLNKLQQQVVYADEAEWFEPVVNPIDE